MLMAEDWFDLSEFAFLRKDLDILILNVDREDTRGCQCDVLLYARRETGMATHRFLLLVIR
jgi:hypothetical protein